MQIEDVATLLPPEGLTVLIQSATVDSSIAETLRSVVQALDPLNSLNTCRHAKAKR
jgi:hypothetical protein